MNVIDLYAEETSSNSFTRETQVKMKEETKILNSRRMHVSPQSTDSTSSSSSLTSKIQNIKSLTSAILLAWLSLARVNLKRLKRSTSLEVPPFHLGAKAAQN